MSRDPRPPPTARPHFPQPLAAEALVRVAMPATTLAALEAQYATVCVYRKQISAAIDTIALTIQQNHANYLAGRGCWSYDTRIEAEAVLKTLHRQQQHLQEVFEHVDRQLKRQDHPPRAQVVQGPSAPDTQAQRFVEAAKVLLDAETYAMLWEFAQEPETAGRV
jgi:hypothetical protein